MILLSRILLGIAFKTIKIATLTYIGSKESDYTKAYQEEQEMKNSSRDNDDDENANHEQKSSKGIQMKKTALIFVAISTYLPALIGPGNNLLFAVVEQDISMYHAYLPPG